MRIVWEEKDIKCGLRVGVRESVTTHFIVGFDPSRAQAEHYCIISLSDGMITNACVSKAKVVEFFNTSLLVPLGPVTLLKEST